MAKREIPSTGNLIVDVAIGAAVLIGTGGASMFVGEKRQANKDKAEMQRKELQLQELIRKRDAIALKLKQTSMANREEIAKLKEKQKRIIEAIKAKKKQCD